MTEVYHPSFRLPEDFKPDNRRPPVQLKKDEYTITLPDSGTVTVDAVRPSLRSRIFPNSRFAKLEKSVTALSKELAPAAFPPRPVGDILQSYQYAGLRSPKTPYRIGDLYWLNRVQPILKTATFNIREEIFRRGLKWEPEFAFKCKQCDQEFQEDPTPPPEPGPEAQPDFLPESPGEESAEQVKQAEIPKECPECGGPLKEPERTGIDDADEFFERVNANEQNFLTVLRQFEDAINIVDDAYIILRKDYDLDQENGIVKEKLVSLLWGNPDVMRISADRYDMLGGTYWFCPLHRKGPDQVVWRNPKAADYISGGYSQLGPIRPDESEIPTCKHDGGKLWEAAYVATYDGVLPEFYYAEHEIIHASKYEPSALYGFSPTVTIWTLATALLNMERYIQDYYREMRVPQGVLMVTTDNPQAAYRSWDITVQRTREDPWAVPMWAVSSQKGKGDAKFIEFRSSPKEMELIAVREEFRQRVSALFGVANIFMGDTSTSGGLNNEGMQIQVTNRALERGQRIYTDIVFPRIVKLFGVEDYKLTFPRLELAEEAERMQVELANLQFAQGMKQLGYDVDMKEDEEGKHEFSFKKMEQQPGMMPGQEEGGFGEGQMGGLAQRLSSLKPGESLEIGPEESREAHLGE
ncbi:MAG: phage portal protein [Candidatus Thermoplasmatota archaeon]|nr:phage portal protein [Candidatus Thermoplasmatota archaeon]